MARKLAWAGGIFIVVAGTLLYFVHSWSGERRVVGKVSPVNESVWEHTRLVVVPVLLLGGMELLLLHLTRPDVPFLRGSSGIPEHILRGR